MIEKKKSKLLKTKSPFSDSYWNFTLVTKLVQKGKKDSVIETVWRTLSKIKIQSHKDPLKIIFFILVKNRPILGFAPIRISREVKKVPLPLSPRRQLIVSLTWFITALKLTRYRSKNIPIEDVLYMQLKAALYKEKTLLTNRRLNHIKELIENRVNLHFRWKLQK